MRKYIVLGLLGVFTLVGGTAVAAGLLVKQQNYYFNKGVQTNEEDYFDADNWDNFDSEDGCEGDSQVPCHIPASSPMDLQNILDTLNEDLVDLLELASERP